MVCPADQCKTAMCLAVNGKCVDGPNIPNNTPCNADNDACTPGDSCQDGLCSVGAKLVCPPLVNETCKYSQCDNSTGGTCITLSYKDADKVNCSDNNICTTGDVCVGGNCAGTIDPTLIHTAQCGTVPPSSVQNQTTIAFAIAGAVAAIGAIIGVAFLIKKVRNSRIDDPDTWSPDTFHSIGSNPLYKGSESVVTNRMYEGAR